MSELYEMQSNEAESVLLVGVRLRGEEEWNIPLEDNDLVNIPDAGVAHITGRGVTKAGSYPLSFFPKTLLQLIDEAEGLRFEASKRLRLFRTESNGERSEFAIRYTDLTKDRTEDIVLQAGDKVVTKTVPWKVVVASTARVVGQIVNISIYGRYDMPGFDDGS